jgi:DNA polymerase elongation subunit (family B)
MSKIINLSNDYENIITFSRDNEGNQIISEDTDMIYYWFEPSVDGKYTTFDGQKVEKCFEFCPHQIKKRATNQAYECDIKPTKRFLIDKVEKLEKPEKIRYQIFDIENLAKKLPKPFETGVAQEPISCITIYDNFLDTTKQWYLGDYGMDHYWDMIKDFIMWVQENPADLMIAHNMYFYDYPFLYYHIPEFAKQISPVRKSRYGQKAFQVGKFLEYPMGISMIDSLIWIKNYTLNKSKSYALDSLMQEYLGYGKKQKKPDFSQLSPAIQERNLEDVIGLKNLFDHFGLIDYYDEIRRMTKVEWEDLRYPMRCIEGIAFQVAKEKGMILPTLHDRDAEEEGGEEEIEVEGAFREAFERGRFFNLGKYDLGSAYPMSIVDLCLDIANIKDEPNENTIEVTITDRISRLVSHRFNVEQNEKALLPSMIKKLLATKNHIKKELNNLDPNNPEYKNKEIEYASIKGLVNSAYGILATKYFRLHDNRIASMITSAIRSLLYYVKEELEKRGYKIIYIDTDSFFIDDKGKDCTELLNNLIKEWGYKHFNKEVNIEMDYEGHFLELLILKKCRYMGNIRRKDGKIKSETKGLETKRNDSSQFLKEFQKELCKKILANETEQDIRVWITDQKEVLKKSALIDIAFPVKFSKDLHQYKNVPIGIRAMLETDGFEKEVGEDFYYVYVEPEYYTVKEEKTSFFKIIPGKREGTSKKQIAKISDVDNIASGDEIFATVELKDKKKSKNVEAFDEFNPVVSKQVDYDKMIERNITNKVDVIFECLGWSLDKI